MTDAPSRRGLHVRRAGPGDAETVAQLGERVFVETFESADNAADVRAYVAEAFAVERVRGEIVDAGSTVLIGEVDGKPVGYARLLVGEPDQAITGEAPVELVRLYVHASQHGAGVGAGLMQASIDAARAEGRRTMWLGVWERNSRAIAFYRKWGFERVGEHSFLLGSEEQTDWLMQRSI